MSRRLYVGNLHFDVTDSRLRDIFAQAGGVEHAEVIKDRWTGLSRGFGFVDMMTLEDAQAAVEELDGSEIMGRSLRVAIAKPRDNKRTQSGASSRD